MAKRSKLEIALSKRDVPEAVLDGPMLVVDPASGAKESLPGYAVFVRGVRVESGTIDVGGPEMPRHKRLKELARTLREDFPQWPTWAVVVIEDVPMQFHEGKGRGKRSSLAGQVTLHKACGAVESAVETDIVLYVAPATWWAHAGKHRHIKGDENDAVAMGECVLFKAQQAMAERERRKTARKKPRNNEATRFKKRPAA